MAIAKYKRLETVLSLDFKALTEFLDDTCFADKDSVIAFKLVSAWALRLYGAEQANDAAENSEIYQQLQSLLDHVRLAGCSVAPTFAQEE